MRTPLATLQSHMEAMIDGIWEADTERLKSCHEEIVRLNRMVGDLEKLAKYESENLVLNRTEFDIDQLIRRIVQNFESQFKNKSITLDYLGESLIISADKDKISQVVVNLLSNALKYTETGGTVKLKLLDNKDSIEFIVADNGVGISEEDKPYIFERFYRADKSRNRFTGGAGIGLTIIKTILDVHKGSIKVESELGKGTIFQVKLPK